MDGSDSDSASSLRRLHRGPRKRDADDIGRIAEIAKRVRMLPQVSDDDVFDDDPPTDDERLVFIDGDGRSREDPKHPESHRKPSKLNSPLVKCFHDKYDSIANAADISDVQDKQVTPKRIRIIVDGINIDPVLASFTANHWQFGDEHLVPILQALLASCPVIHTLEFVNTKMGDGGARALAAIIKERRRYITRVNIADNPDITVYGLQDIAAAICTPGGPPIEFFAFGLHFGDTAIGPLIQLIGNPHGVDMLDVRHNNITDITARVIADVIAEAPDTSLRTLDLDNNRITAGGIRAILGAFDESDTPICKVDIYKTVYRS